MERNEYQQYYLNALNESEFAQRTFDELKRLSLDDPVSATRMNEIVKAKALDDNLDINDVTGILAAGAPVQAAVDQNMSASSLNRMITEATRSYYQDWYDKASGAVAQAQTTISQETKAFVSNAYNALQATENAVFSITPLPLRGSKSFIQSIAAPLAVTAIASRIPGADLLISGATHLGSSLTSTATTMIAGSALAHFGNSFMNALPTGMGIHTVAGAVGTTLENMTMGAVNASAQVVGQVGTAVLIGNAAIKSTQAFAAAIAEKGIVQSFFEVSQKSAAVIERTQAFIKSIQDKFAPKGEKAVSQNQIAEQYNDPALRDQVLQGKVVGVAETENSFLARRGDSSIKDVQMETTNNPANVVVQGEYLVPKEGYTLNPMNADTFSALYEMTGEVKPGDRMGEELKLVSPAKVSLDSDGKYQLVEKGQVMTAELYQQRSSTPARERQSTEPTSELTSNADQPSRVPDFSKNGQVEPSLNGQVPESSQPEAPKPIPIVAEDEPAPKPLFSGQPDEPEQAKPTAPIAQSETDKQYENAALSMLNMNFGSRGIDIKNAQIDLDGQTVFKLKNNTLETSKLDQQAHEMLQKAMSDPANLKGEVKISVGGQLLLHVKDGQVLAGHAFVKESVKAEVSTPSQVKYNELSQNVRATGYEKTKQVAQAAFASGMEAKAVTEMLSQHDSGYKELQDISPKTNEQIISQAQSRAKQSEATVEPQQTKQEQESRWSSKAVATV